MLAEELQRKYPGNRRFLKWVRRAGARWLNKARNILIDSAHCVSKRLVEVAREYNAVIVFEDLEKIRERTVMVVGNCRGRSRCGAIGGYRSTQSTRH